MFNGCSKWHYPFNKHTPIYQVIYEKLAANLVKEQKTCDTHTISPVEMGAPRKVLEENEEQSNPQKKNRFRRKNMFMLKGYYFWLLLLYNKDVCICLLICSLTHSLNYFVYFIWKVLPEDLVSYEQPGELLSLLFTTVN